MPENTSTCNKKQLASDGSITPNLIRRFGGTARLYGKSHFKKLTQSHICIIGVGGVGSWAVETLIRSAVGAITIIDLDNVSESNCNRQLSALNPYFGQAKVAVIKERMKAINPSCQVTAIEDLIDANNLDSFLTERFDYLIDAIDSSKTKAALAAWCLKNKQPLIVCGGAGGRIEPSYIQVADLGLVQGDPLLANMRYKLRKNYGFTQGSSKKMNIPSVYSDEPVRHPTNNCTNPKASHNLSCSGYGSSMAVTASFGLIAAAFVINRLSSKA